MKYVGSKARFAKHIAPIVNEAVKKSNDLNKNPIALFKEAINGRKFPAFVSREMHEEARNGKFDDALTAYIGFCASYRGVYFAGYMGNNHPEADGRIRDYQRETINNFFANG